jgi:hypothetical protein
VTWIEINQIRQTINQVNIQLCADH